jgi:hypothetical protein
MVNDNLKLTGALTIALNDKVVQEIDNLVVTAGKNYVASRMKDTTKAAMSHMAVGTGTTTAAASQTALVTENDRNALTSQTVTGNAIAYVATWAAGDATAALTEAGIFNASSSGDMLCRTVFSVVNKASADSMTITWTVTVS